MSIHPSPTPSYLPHPKDIVTPCLGCSSTHHHQQSTKPQLSHGQTTGVPQHRGSPAVAKPPPDCSGIVPHRNSEPLKSLGTRESQPIESFLGDVPSGTASLLTFVPSLASHSSVLSSQPTARGSSRPPCTQMRLRWQVTQEQRVPMGAWCPCHPRETNPGNGSQSSQEQLDRALGVPHSKGKQPAWGQPHHCTTLHVHDHPGTPCTCPHTSEHNHRPPAPPKHTHPPPIPPAEL